MEQRAVSYQSGGSECRGQFLFEGKEARPTVLVFHDWTGVADFALDSGRKLVEQGYNAFVADMYGEARTGSTKEEKGALMTPLMEDRGLLKERVIGALKAAEKQAECDSGRLGAVGFCLGGLCVLDLARSGADLAGVVSFHGLLGAPNTPPQGIKAKVLVLHGHDDPMVPPDHVLQFQKEMTEAGVDWQVHSYGQTTHAFANPAANDASFGTVYSERSASRAWKSALDFLGETLA